MALSPVRVTVWNEFRHERENKEVARIYPDGMHVAIARYLEAVDGFTTRTATLDQPEHGLTKQVLAQTDTLVWWGHIAHDSVSDAVAERVQQAVLAGMGLIVLHSGHGSKPFKRLLGTNCSLRWREANERERLWNLAPGHEITRGIGDYIELPAAEMYGERFDIPEPDKLIFLSWFQGGEVFRSGCVWERGNGRIFYFKPGHETYPVFAHQDVLRVIANAARWARRKIDRHTLDHPNIRKPLEKIG
ncbi:MAG: trehalose utilization protein ThuA [Chitinivibrionales bacterium]|nr:trehalose utilization protein ThuA [Chitinivibrionales bacterium]MBD3396411.1 trehalose utilization protein ThuA [Chitinivibrionales bacterium]